MAFDPLAYVSTSSRKGFFLVAGGPVYWFASGSAALSGEAIYVALGLALLVSTGGLFLPSTFRVGSSLVSLGLVGLISWRTPSLWNVPDTALVVLLSICGALYWLWSDPRRGGTAIEAGVRAAQPACITALLTTTFALGLPARNFVDEAVLLVTPALPLLLLPSILDRSLWRIPRVLAAAVPGAVLGASMFLISWHLSLLAAFVAMDIVLLAGVRPPRQGFAKNNSFSELLLTSPSKMLVVTFLGTCTIGSLLLAFPAASSGTPASGIDAIFTAVSATCVTGLVTLDTPGDFSIFGQSVILVLIQVGGLGIMTFSTAALLILRRRLSVRAEGAVSSILGSDRRGLGVATRRIFLVTVLCESVGALLPALAFHADGDAPRTAAWRGLFTAVSAFCNAGFALQSDSLVGYQSSPFVLHLVAALVVTGGLGPLVVVEGLDLFRGKRVSLHTRIVLSTSAVLLFLPALFILAQEWSNAFAGLSTVDRLSNAWFQSVTTRTAGFNSVDQTHLHPSTRTLVQCLMFVGGSPGSTAGGIKTTTLLLIVISVFQATRAKAVTSVWGRRIPFDNLHRAFSVVVFGAVSCVGATVALQLTQDLSLETALFEAVSAVNTVGLSLGGTAALDSVGKVIIILCMFAGRVGPVTLAIAIGPEQEAGRWVYPEQEILVG